MRESAPLLNMLPNMPEQPRPQSLGVVPHAAAVRTRRAAHGGVGVRVEAVAALANLAVNDKNEQEIARVGGLEVILDGAKAPSVDLRSQCARALRNLSVNTDNKARLRDLGAIPLLRDIAASRGTRAAAQAQRALENLEASDKK